MSDLINRQEAIDRLLALSYDDWNKGVSTSWANAYSECAEIIRDLPAAQPKIGKWENRNLLDTELGMATYTDDCSVCKLSAIRLIEGDGWKWEIFYQFCPNCGAKMEVNVNEKI